MPEPMSPERHRSALERFNASADFFASQRRREFDDLRFVDFDEQWPEEVKALRGGQDAKPGQPAIPARPRLTINQLRAPVQQVTNTQRNAKLALQFAPKGDGADKATADAYEDIVRAIQADSRAHLARNWAFDRAAKCGLGWYRIDTQYVHDNPSDEDPSADDQEIVYRRILNQASVYPDPFAQEPDWSDGRCAFITQDLPFNEYKRAYPDSKLAEADSDVLSSVGDDLPWWIFTAEGSDTKTVRIAEYWEVEETERKNSRGRRFIERKVWWSKINAVEVLEGPQLWNGSHIPIVPVIGEESNVNGERRWIGIVRPGRDAQISYNVMRSGQVEQVALSSRIPYELDPEQIEGYEPYWQQANTRNFPYLPRKSFDRNGRPFLPITRNVVEPPIQAITVSAHEAKDDIHATTGIPPVALGQLDPHERSGKAIRALQGQAEVGTSGFLDNLAAMSMIYEGKIVRDLIPRIYDRPGRVVPAVGLDEQRRQVMINQPFVEQDGAPVPAQPGQDGAKMIDLKRGEYSVAVTVGKSYTTRRQEMASVVGELMQVIPPEMAAAIAPAWLEAQDYPESLKIAEIAKKALPPQLAAAYEQEGQGPQIPPEVQAQMQQLQAQLQEAAQIIQTEQAKHQADLQKAQLSAQADLQKTQMEIASRERIASLNADVKLTDIEARINAAVAQAMIAFQTEQMGMAHQRAMADVDQRLALEQGEQAHGQQLEQGAMGHQNALEQQAAKPMQNGSGHA